MALDTRKIRRWELKDSPEDGTESAAKIPNFKSASIGQFQFFFLRSCATQKITLDIHFDLSDAV